MKTIPLLSLLVLTLLTGGLFAFGQEQPKKEPPQEEQKVTLLRRQDNGAYKQSAYSFRQATREDAKHANHVDLVFDTCGGMHVTPYAGVTSRITDLGRGDLAEMPAAAPEGAEWSDMATPLRGHVYLQEIAADGQTMTVRFRVEQVTAKDMTLTWLVVKPLKGPEPAPRGKAGTMGACGGMHDGE